MACVCFHKPTTHLSLSHFAPFPLGRWRDTRERESKTREKDGRLQRQFMLLRTVQRFRNTPPKRQIVGPRRGLWLLHAEDAKVGGRAAEKT